MGARCWLACARFRIFQHSSIYMRTWYLFLRSIISQGFYPNIVSTCADRMIWKEYFTVHSKKKNNVISGIVTCDEWVPMRTTLIYTCALAAHETGRSYAHPDITPSSIFSSVWWKQSTRLKMNNRWFTQVNHFSI